MADPAKPSSTDSSFAITIDDTSPTIVYSPFADTFGAPDFATGWNPYFSLPGGILSNSSVGEDSNSTSVHVTLADGASLAVRWNGTGVMLYGSFPVTSPSFPSSLTYAVTLDGTPTTNYASSISPDVAVDNNILASFTNLTNGEHLVELTMRNPTGLSDEINLLQFDRVVITSHAPLSDPSNAAVSTVLLPDESISYRGQWSFDSHLLPGQNLSFHTSTNVGDQASLVFNGTAVTLSGMTTPLSGSYNISLDNEPPSTLSARSTFNDSTLLFYQTGLDPNILHQLDILNLGALGDEQGAFLVVGSVNVTCVVPSGGGATPVGTMSSSLPRGTIAALSVGIVIAVIALAILAIYFLYRRHRAKRRKEGFIVNPRVTGLRRLSFHPRSGQSRKSYTEKEHAPIDQGVAYSAEILDISARKDDGEDDEDETEENRPQMPQRRNDSRHASQNSDGSYSIDLPRLQPQAHIPSVTDSGSPSPVLFATFPPPTKRSSEDRPSSAPHSPTPRSPKPRGPRDMRASMPVHEREGSQGILLKVMCSPTANAPSDVRDGSGHTPTDINAPPTPSPLRVNFEDELAEHAQQRRGGKYRSGFSGISLPRSLKQALWGHDPNRLSAQPVMLTPSDRRDARLSFLDMESSASNSVSGGTPSTRHSRSTSTRSSSKSHRNANDSEYSAPGRGDVPPLPQDHRRSLGLSMTLAGGPTSSRPSLSPAVSLHAVSLPPLTISDSPSPNAPDDVPQSVHPRDLSEYLPSPTESLPLTLSDINFRHSSQSTTSIYESQQAANRMSESHRFPHPPLPGSPGSQPPEKQPYIVQRLLGIQTAGSGPSTPYASPTAPAFAPVGPRWSRGRGSVIGPSFSSAMKRPTTG